MNSEPVGEPGVSAFLRSVLRNLADIRRMECTYTNFFYYDPNPHLEKMKRKLVSLQDVLVDGEARRLDEVSVDEWMDDLKHLFYDLEDILDDVKSLWKGQVRHDDLNSFSDDIKIRFEKILARAKKLGKKARKLELKRGKSEPTQPSSSLDRRATSSMVDTSEIIYGREEDKDVIVKRLLEVDGKGKKNYDVVGIWGMGGLGKTTLAQLVFNDPEVERRFEVRRWVCISDVFDVRQAIKGLIGNGSAGDAQSLEYLHQRLQKIIQNKRFLFVLDDVWPSTGWNEKWDMIKAPFNSCQNGSKILVTTRDCNIAHALGDEKQHKLEGLPHEQCILLFKDSARVNDGEKDKLMVWGDKIVRACKGLPLAIKVTGSMLQMAKEEKWRAVSENTDRWDISNIEDGIHPSIRLSYHYLPASLKRCFEYLAVFPPDFKFDKDDVVRLWIADGLVEAEESRRVEDIGNEYYNELKARSLIQDNDTMHDIVQHLATVVSRKFCYRENSKEPLTSVRQAFLVYLNSMHYEFLAQAPCLRTLNVITPEDENVVRNTLSMSWKMLRTMKINFQNKNYSLEKSSTCHLTHLRYLSLKALKSCDVLDSVCMLDNLKFLVLNQMHLKQLPEDIGNLRSLRALVLSNSSILSLSESICSLCELQVLNLLYCDGLKELPNNIGNLRSLRILNLQGTSISSLPESIFSLCRLLDLNLYHCRYLEELPKDIGKLRSLRTLRLGRSSISSLPESICSLCQLLDLNLYDCRYLKELPKDIGNLRSLRTLDLSSSPVSSLSISSLPESICSLCELQVLDLDHCNELKELPKDMGDLRSLRRLNLLGTSILSVPESILNVTGLQSLLVSKSNQLPLRIGRLEGLKTLSNVYHAENEGLETLSNFYHVENEEGRRLGELNRMNKLKGRLIIASMENVGGVEEAKMADLKSKKNIKKLEFRWSQPGNDEEMEVKIMEALQPYHALQSLTLSNYGGNKFPAWMMAGNICRSNLTWLTMEGLNKICEMIDMEFVSLHGLRINDCPKLRKVVMATPKLRLLIMNDCEELEADSLHLLPSLSDKVGLLSIVSQLEELECDYNIFEYFFEKLKTANLKWYELLRITLNARARRVPSLPGGWPSIMDCIRTMRIKDIGPGKFQFLPDGDQSPFPF